MRFDLFRRRDPAVQAEQPVTAQKARELIIRGRAPNGLRVSGHLNLSGYENLSELPAELTVDSLDLSGCLALYSLPDDLQVRRLNLNGCRSLRDLTAGLRCYQLEMRMTPIQALPPDLQVEYRLDLEDCADLEVLPKGLKVGSLNLRGCTSLKSLPEGLDVCFLDISGCTSLTHWPQRASVRIGRFAASGCLQLTSLPPWLTEIAQLDISGCTSLSALPEKLCVSSWIDLANTGLQSLPASTQGARLRWRGVPINERIAFHPETISVQEILDERNAELRRVMLERMGYEAFLRETEAEILDRDRDPGGERRLLRVKLEGDEDLVCVSVICPSTGRQYLIRVPPTMRTCRQAAAWIAGFDNPDDYRPIVET